MSDCHGDYGEDRFMYEDDGWEYERGCLYGDTCLEMEPAHTSDKCYTVEMVESQEQGECA